MPRYAFCGGSRVSQLSRRMTFAHWELSIHPAVTLEDPCNERFEWCLLSWKRDRWRLNAAGLGHEKASDAAESDQS